jgi:hypothetical protein
MAVKVLRRTTGRKIALSIRWAEATDPTAGASSG